MRTLVVIDAQSDFLNKVSLPNYDEIVSNIQLMVRHWRKYNWPILFVEYGPDRTLPEIRNPLNNNNFIVKKDEPNGSYQILNTLKKYNLPKELHVCGVNWNQCVQTTIYHLLKWDAEVKVNAYRQASNPHLFRKKYDRFHTWSEIKRLNKDRFKVK